MIYKIFKLALPIFLNQISLYILFFVLFVKLDSVNFAKIVILDGYILLIPIILSLQLDRGCQRYYFNHSNQNYFLIPMVNTLLFLIVVVFLFFIASLFTSIENYDDYLLILLLSGLISVYNSVVIFYQTNLNYLKIITLSLIKNITLISISLYLYIYDVDNYKFYIFSLIAVYILSLIYLSYKRNLIDLIKNFIYFIKKNNIRDIYLYSIPYLPVVFFSWLINTGGRYFFTEDNYSEQLSIYGFWYKITSIYILFSAILNILYLPKIMIYLKNNIKIIKYYQNYISLFFIISTFSFFCLILIFINILNVKTPFSLLIVTTLIVVNCIGSYMGSYSDIIINFKYKSFYQLFAYFLGGITSFLINYNLYNYIGTDIMVISHLCSVIVILITHSFIDTKFFNLIDFFKFTFYILFSTILMIYIYFIENIFLTISLFTISLMFCFLLLYRINLLMRLNND